MKHFLFLLTFALIIPAGCSNKQIKLTPAPQGTSNLIPECDGGTWASRTEHTSAFGIKQGLDHTEALYFCCPGKGTMPICRRASWTDQRSRPNFNRVESATPPPQKAHSNHLMEAVIYNRYPRDKSSVISRLRKSQHQQIQITLESKGGIKVGGVLQSFNEETISIFDGQETPIPWKKVYSIQFSF